ncbi:MAG: hypothetical protein CMC04_08980 [Flavobacteriaceae bacterium]|nr:hypothetical protein [Flavobacteriaceae bacterium]
MHVSVLLIKKLCFLMVILLFFPIVGFTQSNLQLGERVNFKNFSNAQGVNISFQEPNGWQKGDESFATDKNNLVISYLNTSELLILQLYISKTPFGKMEKNEVEKTLNSKEFLDSYINKKYSGESGYKLDNTSLTYINGYPFIQVLAESYKVQYQVNWMTFIEDKMINIVCVSLKDNFVNIFPFFNKFKESINLKEN